MKRKLVISGRAGGDPEKAAVAVARGNELWEGARWVLEREAEAGRLVWNDPPVYLLAMEAGPIRTGDLGPGPGLSDFYTIAYDRVLVLSLAERGSALPDPA